VEIVPFAQSNHLLGKRPQLFGFGNRGEDPFLVQKVRHHVAEHGLSMTGGATEFSTCTTMSHVLPNTVSSQLSVVSLLTPRPLP